MDATAAWEKFLAETGLKPSESLIEAFFSGYRMGVNAGLTSGRELAFRLVGITQYDGYGAPAEPASN